MRNIREISEKFLFGVGNTILQGFMFPLVTLMFLKIIGNKVFILSKAYFRFKETILFFL